MSLQTGSAVYNQAAFPSAKSVHWFFRYKLYHIPFWFVYHCTWWAITIGNPVAVLGSAFSSPYGIKNLFYVVFQALGVYFNLYYLLPKFLERGRYGLYIILVVSTIIAVAVCIVPGYYISSSLSGVSFENLYNRDPSDYLYFFQINTLPSSVASMTLAMSVKLTKNWLQSRRREELLAKVNMETELKFLKYQYNPHFLFNTINSIFFLIHKNPDKASASLAKFSELLRHQLYESNDKFIQLAKEINYLENFIDLEKLRHDSNMDVSVQMSSEGSNEFAIAPFILMTFVENAFKHVSKDAHTPNRIKIGLTTKGDILHFNVFNDKSALRLKEAVSYGGIGLQNVRRRLELLYPGKYELEVTDEKDFFEIKLMLHLCPYASIESKVYEPANIFKENKSHLYQLNTRQ